MSLDATLVTDNLRACLRVEGYASSNGVERSRVRIHLRTIPRIIPDIDETRS